MTKPMVRIVVIGRRNAFSGLFDYLEETGRYQLAYTTLGMPAVLVEPRPDVVLLHMPNEEFSARQTLPCIDIFKGYAPVVVMSDAADMGFYMSAITHGAFDYITSYTPVVEIERVLANAIRWRRQKVA